MSNWQQRFDADFPSATLSDRARVRAFIDSVIEDCASLAEASRDIGTTATASPARYLAAQIRGLKQPPAVLGLSVGDGANTTDGMA
ncbi:MAG: hypothetical protein NVS1B6_09300 [Steroidobacteraceae bacterium]